jgi:hypothetical protein
MMALLAANFVLLSSVGPSYFPGDAPIADLVLEFAGVVWGYSAVGLVVAFVAARCARTRFLQRAQCLP